MARYDRKREMARNVVLSWLVNVKSPRIAKTKGYNWDFLGIIKIITLFTCLLLCAILRSLFKFIYIPIFV